MQYVKFYTNDVNMYLELHSKINFTASHAKCACQLWTQNHNRQPELYVIQHFVNNMRDAALELQSQKSKGKPKLKNPNLNLKSRAWNCMEET